MEQKTHAPDGCGARLEREHGLLTELSSLTEGGQKASDGAVLGASAGNTQ
jgi:hypothetical protein